MFWEGCRKLEIGLKFAIFGAPAGPERQNTDFECRAGSGAAGDRKTIDFQLNFNSLSNFGGFSSKSQAHSRILAYPGR